MRNIKKLTTAALTMILAASMSMSAFAASEVSQNGMMQRNPGQVAQNGNRQTNNGMPFQGNMQQPDGEGMPEFPEFTEGERPERPELTEGEMPELPEGVELDENGMPEMHENGLPMRGRGDKGMPFMLNPDAVQSAIDSVSEDGTDTSELQSLLDAYTSALDAERAAMDNEDTDIEASDIEELRTAVKEAEEALQSALSEAGIEIENDRPEIPDGSNRPMPEADNSMPRFSETMSDSSDAENPANQYTAMTNISGRAGDEALNNMNDVPNTATDQNKGGFTGALKSFGQSVKNAFANLLSR